MGGPVGLQGEDTLKMKVADGMESTTNTAENHPGTKAGRLPWKAHLHSTEWSWQTVLCLPALPPLPLHLATSQPSSGDHPPHRSSRASMKLIHPQVLRAGVLPSWPIRFLHPHSLTKDWSSLDM